MDGTIACECRWRDIAIRKIHGAKTATIIRLFLRYYIRLLLASGILAFSVGYYLMYLWVRQHVRQTSIPMWIYPPSFAMSVLILLTVYWQIRRAARQNLSDEIRIDQLGEGRYVSPIKIADEHYILVVCKV